MLLHRISLGAVVALALAACAELPTASPPGSAPHADLTSGRTAMHRLFMGSTNDHLYSRDPDEGTAGSPAYTLEHYEYFFLEPDSLGGHVPLYRCWRAFSSPSGDHWLSTDDACEGALTIERSGWIATSELTGTVPLYSQYNPTLDDTFHTTDLSEAQYADANYGYSTPVVIGYVYLTE